jgi:uncharacterized protein YciI
MDMPTPLHLVLLEFADRSRAPEHMDGHNRWIDDGFADGVFVLTGTMPGRGGTVWIRGLDTAEVQERLGQDPFVEHGVVSPQIIEVEPSRVDPALDSVFA